MSGIRNAMVSFPLSVPEAAEPAAAELELPPALEVPVPELVELPAELHPATTAVAATDRAAKCHALALLIFMLLPFWVGWILEDE
jgi:hypothetical protein